MAILAQVQLCACFQGRLSPTIFLPIFLAMSVLDSQAVFSTRALELGLWESELTVLKAKDWNTFGKVAFASSYQTGQADETPLLKLAGIITGSGAADPPE